MVRSPHSVASKRNLPGRVRTRTDQRCGPAQRRRARAPQNAGERFVPPPFTCPVSAVTPRNTKEAPMPFILFRQLGLLGIAIALVLYSIVSSKEDRSMLLGGAGICAAIWAVVAFGML
jgi:hypothetical protein